MPRLGINERQLVVQLRAQKKGYGAIMKIMNQMYHIYISRKAIQKICKKFEATGFVMDKKRNSKSKLDRHDVEEFVNSSMKKEPDLPAKNLSQMVRKQFNIQASSTLMARYRRKLGWRQQNTRYCQMIRQQNKVKRAEWCELQQKNNETFDNVIFTDESKIEMCSMSKKWYTRAGDPPQRHGKPKHPYSVLVWGGISRKGRTPLVIFTGIMDSVFFQQHILKDAFLPFVKTLYSKSHRLYQDNDPKHTSKSTQSFMDEHGICWWKSPAESPDLNPIENLWAEMKRYIARTIKPQTKDELVEGLHKFWETVTPEKCQRYINHIYKVLPEVLKQKGGPSGF